MSQVGISNYVKELGKIEAFQDYDLNSLEGAVAEAVTWGLLSPIDPNYPDLLIIQPVLPYFLNTKLKENDLEIRAAIKSGFKNYYLDLAKDYNSLLQAKKEDKK